MLDLSVLFGGICGKTLEYWARIAIEFTGSSVGLWKIRMLSKDWGGLVWEISEGSKDSSRLYQVIYVKDLWCLVSWS